MNTAPPPFSRRLASLAVFVFLSATSFSATAAPPKASTSNGAGSAAARAHAHLGSAASDLNECSTQASTCLDDDECLECMTSYVDHPLEYGECLEAYDSDWSSVTECDAKVAQPCCFDLVSRGNCLESGYFLEYWGCWLEEFGGCPDYELTCSSPGTTSDGRSGSSNSNSSGGNGGSSSGSSSSSTPGDEVVDQLRSDENGVAGVAPSRKIAVVATSSLAGILAAGALLL